MMKVSAYCASVPTHALCPALGVKKLSLITSPTKVRWDDMFAGHQESKPPAFARSPFTQIPAVSRQPPRPGLTGI